METIQISDEELQLSFNYLMKNIGVLNVPDFSKLDDHNLQYSAEELALEVV